MWDKQDDFHSHLTKAKIEVRQGTVPAPHMCLGHRTPGLLTNCSFHGMPNSCISWLRRCREWILTGQDQRERGRTGFCFLSEPQLRVRERWQHPLCSSPCEAPLKEKLLVQGASEPSSWEPDPPPGAVHKHHTLQRTSPPLTLPRIYRP